MIAKTGPQKDLGVLISSDLNWEIQSKNEARKTLNVFFMIKRNSPSLLLLLKSKSMIWPTLFYNSAAQAVVVLQMPQTWNRYKISKNGFDMGC